MRQLSIILLLILLGAITTTVLISYGYIEAETVGKYGTWSLLLLLLVFLMAQRTRGKTDDKIVLALMLMTMGGFISVYLIEQGVKEALIILFSLPILFLFVMSSYLNLRPRRRRR